MVHRNRTVVVVGAASDSSPVASQAPGIVIGFMFGIFAVLAMLPFVKVR